VLRAQYHGRPAALRSTEYDCVLLLEVIEHLAHPVAFLAEAARLVRPGGFILITTPAVDNVVGRYLPSWCTHYAPPNHVSLFTWKSFQHLLARCDFEPVRLERDRAWQLLWATASALLYKLDFQSPRHDDDLSDGIYRPNRLGRMLGLTEQRFSNVPLLPLLGLVDALAGKLLARVPGVPMNNHFYVMARRTPTSASSSNAG
jgi:SAM-dependent methyltransferase